MKQYLYILLITALCAGTLLLASQPAHAEFREKGPAVIDRKGPNALMFDGHGFKHYSDQYMAVTFRTRFYDENGEQISFADLKIPCRAQIEYRKKPGSPISEAVSVQVTYYRDNASVDTQWNLPVMKPDRLQ